MSIWLGSHHSASDGSCKSVRKVLLSSNYMSLGDIYEVNHSAGTLVWLILRKSAHLSSWLLSHGVGPTDSEHYFWMTSSTQFTLSTSGIKRDLFSALYSHPQLYVSILLVWALVGKHSDISVSLLKHHFTTELLS